MNKIAHQDNRLSVADRFGTGVIIGVLADRLFRCRTGERMMTQVIGLMAGENPGGNA